MGNVHSVRFNGWLSERELGRLPSLPFRARGTNPRTNDNDGERLDEEYARLENERSETEAHWQEALAAEEQGDLSKTRTSLRAYVEGSTVETCYEYDAKGDCRERRNSAFDRLDALAELERGATANSVKAYLDARRAFDTWKESGGASNAPSESVVTATAQNATTVSQPSTAKAVRDALDRVPRSAVLDDNVAYLRAATMFRDGDFEGSIQAFRRLADQYPKSEKRDAALFMVGRLNLKLSAAGFTGMSAAAEPPVPEGRDEYWKAAEASFTRLLRDYPNGRLAADARGLLAYARIRVGDTAEGIAEYYRILAFASNPQAESEALRSLLMVRNKANAEDASRLETLIEDEPRVALTYAYHTIYNYALRGLPYVEISEQVNPYRYCNDDDTSPCTSDFYRWEDEERKRLRSKVQNKELTRIAAFATRMLRRYPDARVGGAFALRVAQANLELGENKPAHEMAQRALAARLSGDERAAGLWVKGVAEHRLKNFDVSRRTFTTLVSEFPDGDFIEGARRFIAMVAEDAGDLDAALEQYLALHYDNDAAYFLDVLMTPEQIAAFAERHADSPAHEMILYSLGVRYMRMRRFDEARAVYARVRTKAAAGSPEVTYDGDCKTGYRAASGFGCFGPKRPDGEERWEVIPRWILRDLKTMTEVEQFERRFDSATNDEERAEALYQFGSYYYEASELTFYNPASWRGGRFYALYYDHEMRAPNEAQLLQRYMGEHEVLVRALDVYLRAARLYPRSRAARDALYTAAVIHERLSGFLLYWPRQYQEGLYPSERMVTYDDVRLTYPNYQLPRGTDGWQPSTRTVNGGPGWDVPPKPRPLTGMERARRKLQRVERRAAQAWELYGEVADGRVRRWTVAVLRWSFVGLVGAAIMLVFRLTRRSRAALLELIGRIAKQRKTRSAEQGTALVTLSQTSSFASHEIYTARTRAGLVANEVWRSFWAIVVDERGRRALALNIATHGFLSALLYILVWAIK
jgi:TolA-binding protein